MAEQVFEFMFDILHNNKDSCAARRRGNPSDLADIGMLQISEDGYLSQRCNGKILSLFHFDFFNGTNGSRGKL
jgi:hypothetical protein